MASFPVYPPGPSSGPGGTVTTSSPVSGDGSGGSPVTIAAGAIALSKLATQLTQTVLGNGSGSTASPVALTISAATGIIADATTLKNTLITGVSGGQTITGGTASGDGLTITSTSNGTKGSIILGSSTGYVFDQANSRHSWGISAPVSTTQVPWQFHRSVNERSSICVSNPSTGAVASAGIGFTTAASGALLAQPLFILEVKGPNFTTAGLLTAGSALIQHFNPNAPLVYATDGDHIFSNGTTVDRFRIKATGSVTVGTGVATTATDGFLYIPSCAGVPTGVPTSLNSGNTVPMVADRTNNKLYVFLGGAWVAMN